MKIEIRTSGGFAGNIRRPPLIVDTGDLEPAAARELEALAAELPPSPPPFPGRGADLMSYEVIVEDASGRRSATYTEPGVPDAVRALLRRARDPRED